MQKANIMQDKGGLNELALFAGAMKTHWKSSAYAREKAKAWRLANPEKVKAYRAINRRKSYLQESMRKYDLTADAFSGYMEAQSSRCATCKKIFDWGDKQTKPHIDHCHESGRVRGILCNRCNSVLGLVADDAPLLLTLAGYLE